MAKQQEIDEEDRHDNQVVSIGNVSKDEEKQVSVISDEKNPKVAENPAVRPQQGRIRRLIGTRKGKVVTIIAVVILIFTVLLAVPVTRYGILGTFLKKSIKVSISDSVTHKPINAATVSLGSVAVKTDERGVATLADIPVGEYTLKVVKNYYKTAETSYVVPVLSNPKETSLDVVAIGRPVTITVIDKVTKNPVSKASVTVQDTSSVTDEKGIAVIVLPADMKTLKGTVKLDGYNSTDVEIKITEQIDTNKISLTPSGTIYYLSKLTGKVNVMKSNLDGSDAKIVVEGTGNENGYSTVLLAARDWKYMALSATRSNNDKSQIYLVNSTTGMLATIDEGDASFQLIGWSDHRFIYSVTRSNKTNWDDKHQAIKSYDAETGKTTIIDETIGRGTRTHDFQQEQISNPYILEGKLVYTKMWSLGSNYLYMPNYLVNSEKSAIMVANLSNNQKQRVKEFSMQHHATAEAKLYEPQEVYFRITLDNSGPTYYEYEGDSVKTVSNTEGKFYGTYPTYLVSPGGAKTFWHEPRDGKNALFVGDKNGANKKEIAVQSEYVAYGWYSDKYILLSKNGSELYIAPSDKPFGEQQPMKITSYHQSALSFPGYGYGYGGL